MKKPQDFKERFRIALNLRDKTQAEISKATGIDKASISYYLKGKYEPKQDKVYLISKALNVDPGWLMGFDIDMDDIKEEYIEEENYELETLIQVPLLTSVKAGVFTGAGDYEYETFGVDPSLMNSNDEYFIIRVDGESMEPKFEDRDLVLCLKRSDVFTNGSLAVVSYDNNVPVLKKVYKEENRIILKSTHAKYPDMIIENEELEYLRIVGIPKVILARNV